MNWDYIDSLFMAYSGSDYDIAEVTDLSYDTVHRFRLHQTKSPSFDVAAKIVLCLGGSLDALAGAAAPILNYETSDAARVHECMAYFRSELIRKDSFYMKMIKRRKAMIYWLMGLCTVFVVLTLIVLAIDYTTPGMGWIGA